MKTPTSTCSFFALVAGRIQARINRFKEPRYQGRVPETLARSVPLDGLEDYLEVSGEEVARIRDEYAEFEKALGEDITFGSTSDMNLLWLHYLLVRSKKPSLVIETGVWIGSSSFAILTAMKKNGSGKLHSIDFPPFRPKHRVSIGRVVPEEVYSHWSLHLGPSRNLMNKIAKEGELDIFIHDSDHTYLNMMAEFRRGWVLLKPGGYLVSDDSSDNDSILDFSDEIGEPVKLFHREKGGTIALMRKPSAGS